VQPLGQRLDRVQTLAHLLVTPRLGQKGNQRVDQQQAGVVVAQAHLDAVDVVGQHQWLAVVRLEEADARQVGAGGAQARLDGVLQPVLGRHDAHAAGDAARAVRQDAGGGDTRGQVEQQGGLRQAGVARQVAQLAQGQPAGPEPLDRPGADAAEAHRRDRGGRRSLRARWGRFVTCLRRRQVILGAVRIGTCQSWPRRV
jgi:hypothetical protein